MLISEWEGGHEVMLNPIIPSLSRVNFVKWGRWKVEGPLSSKCHRCQVVRKERAQEILAMQSVSSRRNINCIVPAASYLDSVAIEIRERRVCWKSYRVSMLIGDEDYRFITSFESAVTAEQREALVSSNEVQCRETFRKLLSQVSKEQTLQYVLILLNDLLQEKKSRVELFECKEGDTSKHTIINDAFLSLVNRNDEFIAHMASRIITKIACWGRDLMQKADQSFFLSWLTEQLRPGDNYIESVANCLQMLLRVSEYRETFIEVRGIAALLKVLSQRVSCFVWYQSLYCLWLMTFKDDVLPKMNPSEIVPILSDILCSTVKTKVIRVIVAIFRNLVEKLDDPDSRKTLAVTMAQFKILKQLNFLKDRLKGDLELEADAEFLFEKLSLSQEELSSFDEYCLEMESGNLRWSVVHDSASFWHENATRFNENDYKLLRKLTAYFRKSEDPVVLSVAAHDIGKYISHYPRGRSILERLGVKHRAMELLAHGEPSVRYQALLCLQKMMVQKWEFLEKLLEKDTRNKKMDKPQ